MLRCCHRTTLAWGLCALLAGCATTPHTASKSRPTQPPAAKRSSPAPPAPAPDLPEEKRVQAHAHYAQALIYELDDKPDLALKEYTQAALNDPTNEELVLDVSRRYLQRREPEHAVDMLSKASSVPGASGEIFARLGLVYSRMDEEDKAITATQTAIDRAPKSLSGYQNLYLIHLQKARIAQAAQVLETAAKVPDTDVEFLLGLAELFAGFERQAPSQRTSANPTALEVLRRAAKLNPTTPHLQLKLADDYQALGDSTNAAKLYSGLLENYGDLPALRDEVRPKLADIYISNNDSPKAMEMLEAIVRDDPTNPKVYYALGKMAYDQKKLTAAADYFAKALIMNDNFREAYYDLAEVQIDLDRTKEALATLDKARTKYSANFFGEFLSALAYSRQKDYTNALAKFTSAEVIAKATSPNRLDKFFYFEEGSTYERKGDFEQAEKCFDKSLQLEPEFPEALNYLGYMLADRGVKLQRAQELIEKAVKLQPKNPAYVDSLGWVLYKLDRPQEALVQIQKAITLSPEVDATLLDHLGDIYAALKDSDKAREAWRKSLATEPNEDIRKKLDQSTGKKK